TAALADGDDPEQNASRTQQAMRLHQALDELPPEQRQAVLLRLHGELSLEEIGNITGVGRETVKSRLRYAMDRLRGRLQASAGTIRCPWKNWSCSASWRRLPARVRRPGWTRASLPPHAGRPLPAPRGRRPLRRRCTGAAPGRVAGSRR